MGHLEPDRLLDTRYLDLDGHTPPPAESLLSILPD